MSTATIMEQEQQQQQRHHYQHHPHAHAAPPLHTLQQHPLYSDEHVTAAQPPHHHSNNNHNHISHQHHYLHPETTTSPCSTSEPEEEEGEDDTMMNNNVDMNNHMPNEADLVLLCLDHLRDLRRAYSVPLLRQQEGLRADYLTMACWALNRAFSAEQLPNLTDPVQGNDCWFVATNAAQHAHHHRHKSNNTSFSSSNSNTPPPCFPSLEEMERELLYVKNQMDTSNSNINSSHQHHRRHHGSNSPYGDQKKEQDYADQYNSPSSSPEPEEEHDPQQTTTNYSRYEYNDNHVSNAHRFYSLDGLASGPVHGNHNGQNSPSVGGSLTLGEIVAAGLVGLGARTRWQAEHEMLATPLFEQFVAAVQAKGFFDDTTNNNNTPDHGAQQAALYEERFRKVVVKFRVKLAHKALMAAAATASSSSTSASQPSLSQSQQRHQHELHQQQHLEMMHGEEEMTLSTTGGGNGSAAADWMAHAAADQQRKRREYRQLGHSNNNSHYHASESPATPISTASTPGTPLDELAPNSLSHQSRQQHVDEPHLLAGRHDRYNNNNGNTHYHSNVENTSDVGSNIGTDVSAASYVKRTAFAQRLFAEVSDQQSVVTTASAAAHAENAADLQEAERLKMDGNSFMKQKEYQKAADCYTAALKLSPAGPQAHVYFSNRAAALVSLRKFSKAILDSERSLSLKPDYGKAHARLGLAHFLLGNYRQAMQAYTLALKYEPDNKSSQSYMEKAAKRLAETNRQQSSSSSVSSNNYNLSAAQSQGGEGVAGRPPKKSSGGHDVVSRSNSNITAAAARDENNHSHISSSSSHGSSGHRRSSSNASNSTLLRDEKEAEKYKNRGNALMANREYSKALEEYNLAIRLSPAGPQSHVYYSNRAAALCYLERYKEAEEDSIQSLSLDPTYGKAHARLGLSRFFLQKYADAVEAYSDALKYDPDNSASRSYLAKAKAKLNEAAIARSKAVMSLSPPESTARRLMTDESVRIMTQRALQDPSRDLLHDPEMIRLSKKAMAAMRK